MLVPAILDNYAEYVCLSFSLVFHSVIPHIVDLQISTEPMP